MSVPSPFTDDEVAEIKADITAFALDASYYLKRLVATVEQTRRERDDADAVIRRLEDALLLVWAELPIEQTVLLRDELPQLMDFVAHLHHSIEHEQAMVRHNVWTEPSMSAGEVAQIRQARTQEES